MGEFITGVLVENKDGATYQGIIYDRFLKLRLLDGQMLSIFDPIGPISTELKTGETYELILVTLATAVKYFSAEAPPLESSQWQATVVKPKWRALEGSYQRARPQLYSHDRVLLASSLGHLLMNPGDIGTPVSLGGVVQWNNVRLDLYAVV